MGVCARVLAWRLLLEVLDVPPDEGGAGGAQQRHHAATRGGARAPPQHLLLLQPEGQGLSGGDRVETQVIENQFLDNGNLPNKFTKNVYLFRSMLVLLSCVIFAWLSEY